jgi:hypothetical protein
MQVIRFLLFTCLCFSPCVEALAPMTQAYLTERWIYEEMDYKKEQKCAFLQGSLFPSIRYLDPTYPEINEPISLNDIRTSSCPMYAGMLLGHHLESWRFSFAQESGIFTLLNDIPEDYRDIFLQLLEDQVLSEQSDWADARLALETLPLERLQNTGISLESLSQWREELDGYFTMFPSLYLSLLLKEGQGFLHLQPELIISWPERLLALSNDPQVQDYVSALVSAYEEMLLAE